RQLAELPLDGTAALVPVHGRIDLLPGGRGRIGDGGPGRDGLAPPVGQPLRVLALARETPLERPDAGVVVYPRPLDRGPEDQGVPAARDPAGAGHPLGLPRAAGE